MGVSFKVAKAGTRYRPKLLQVEDKDYENDSPTDFQQRNHEGDLVGVEDKVADRSNALAKAKPEIVPVSKNIEVSFSLNLFGNGFSVGKVAEFFNDVPNLLHPYDRTSERLLSAIEYGCLPGELLDDIPSKYVNGALLCEIRDYRNCLPHRDDTAVSASIFPTVHKVLLQMCMENVIKDISSMSDDSWTYKDLLEVESRILKALQPNLHLNPKQTLDRSIGEPLTRKLNLEIAWSRKKRKLSDAPVTNSHEKNVVQEPMLQSFPLPSQSNHQLAPSCNRPVSTTLTLSKFVSTPKQFYSNNNCGPTRPSTLVLSEKGRCDMQAIRGPILKKPKEEPLDFSQFQLPGSEGQTMLGPDLQCKTKLTQQQLEAEKILRERFHGNKHPSLLINNGQQSILEGMPKLQAGMPTCSLKQEPAETSNFLVSDVPKNRDNYLIMDVRSNQSNIQKLALRQSSPLSRMQFNHKEQPGNKNMRYGTLTLKRKALQNPQVSTSVRSAPVSSSHLDSVLREASLPAKQKSNSRSKGSSTSVVESCTNTSNMIEVNASSPLVENLPLPQPLGINGDPVLQRFSKIKRVTQRYGLNYRKRKLNQFLGKRSFSCTTLLVAFHLLNSEVNGNSKDATTHRISLSNCFLDRSLNVSKTRTWTFVRQPSVNSGNKIASVDSEAQRKLIITEKLNEGMVEASVLYGHEEIDSIDFSLPPTFPSTHYAELFAAQFTSLMAHEGYQLSSDRIEPTLSADGGSSSQQSNFSSSAPPAAGTVELTSATPILGPSPYMLSPVSSSMTSLNPCQLISQNIVSGGHSLSLGNIQSALQLSSGYLSKSLLDFGSQVSSIQQQWHQMMNKRALLQFQMQQRQRQQLLQRKMMLGRFGAARGSLGRIQLGGGIQGLGNRGFGPFSDIIGITGSTSVPIEGNMHAIGNMGQINNLDSNVLSFSGSNQSFNGISDPSAAALARLSGAESQVLMSGVPFQRNADVVPMLLPNTPDMAFNLTNQHLQQLKMHQQLHVLQQQQQQQQETRSLFQLPDAASLDDLVVLLPSQVGPQQYNQQFQISRSQLSPGLAPRHMNAENVMVGPESPGLSSRTHGSVNSSNASSSLQGLPGVTKDSKTAKTGRVKQE